MNRHAVLVGATASGKSALALDLARRDPTWELVSVDSMQVYRGMDIGTAKPTAAERAEVPHHLLDLLDPWEDGTVAWFQREARRPSPTSRTAATGRCSSAAPRSTSRRWSTTSTSPGSTRRCAPSSRRTPTPPALHGQLAELDPLAAGRMEPTNRRRIVRALEVTMGSGRPFSSYGPGLDAHPPTAFTLVGLRRDSDDLRARIAARYEQQMGAGFLDEVRRLRDEPRGISRTARQALGYKELLDHLDGALTLDEAARPRHPPHRPLRPPPAGLVPPRSPHRLARCSTPSADGNRLVDALRALVGSMTACA